MRYLSSSILVTLFFGCNKDKVNSSCGDGSCCHPEYNQYVEYVTDMPAYIAGFPGQSEWSLRVIEKLPSNPDNLYKSRILAICENSLNKVATFQPGPPVADTTTIQYEYLVSGKILSDVKNPRLSPEPVLSIFIDQIRKK